MKPHYAASWGCQVPRRLSMMSGHQKMIPTASTHILSCPAVLDTSDTCMFLFLKSCVSPTPFSIYCQIKAEALGNATSQVIEQADLDDIHLGTLASMDMAAKCQVCKLLTASQLCEAAPHSTDLLARSSLRVCSHSCSSACRNFACGRTTAAGRQGVPLKR
jgi:hypothetical protein